MMKIFTKVAVVFLLSLTMLRCCSTREPVVNVNYKVIPFVEEFKKEAKEAGIDVSIIKDSIDDIVFYPLDENIAGLYSPDNRQIVLNWLYNKDSVLLKRVIYHELGHLYGLEHMESGIMQTFVPLEAVHKMYCPPHGGQPYTWEMHKAYLFQTIRKKLKHLDKLN